VTSSEVQTPFVSFIAFSIFRLGLVVGSISASGDRRKQAERLIEPDVVDRVPMLRGDAVLDA
jgi:hypothetical protein